MILMAADPILELLVDKKQAPVRKVGAEFERLALGANQKPVSYSRDVRPLLEELVKSFQWETYFDFEGQILGIRKGRNYMSLEPGAQLEIAAAPKENLFDVKDSEAQILNEIAQTKSASSWTWIEQGINRFQTVGEVELIPSPRYQYMTNYFPKHGKRGLEMMRLTTGTHLNIDFYLEPEAIEMLRVGSYLSPFVTALFANSPVPGKSYSERALVWRETDDLRSGWPELFFKRGMGLEEYSEFVRSRPMMYFMNDEDLVEEGDGRSFNDLRPELRQRNALNALRQIFTEARLKPCCVEIRCFDQLPENYRYASLAFVLGLVYEDSIRQELNEEALEWGHEKIKALHFQAATESLKNDFLFEKCQELYDRARSGLLKRGFGEESLLAEAKGLLEQRKSPAQLLLDERADKGGS